MSARMKQFILQAAGNLFARQGFNSTGVDHIASEAQVSKVTLYKYYKSKEVLIVEYLKAQDEKLWTKLAQLPQQATAKEELEALVTTLLAVISEKDFKGFASLHARMEFPESDNPVNQTAKEFSKQLRDQIAEIAIKAGIKSASSLAMQLALVVEGASISHRDESGDDSILHAKSLVKTLIKAAD